MILGGTRITEFQDRCLKLLGHPSRARFHAGLRPPMQVSKCAPTNASKKASKPGIPPHQPTRLPRYRLDQRTTALPAVGLADAITATGCGQAGSLPDRAGKATVQTIGTDALATAPADELVADRLLADTPCERCPTRDHRTGRGRHCMAGCQRLAGGGQQRHNKDRAKSQAHRLCLSALPANVSVAALASHPREAGTHGNIRTIRARFITNTPTSRLSIRLLT